MDDRRNPTEPPATPPRRRWRFGPFLLDEGERRLTAGGEPRPLAPKAFDLLVLLVERHGRLARRDELMAGLWPDTFVEDATLARHLSDVRKALGAEGARIETVPKAGYRFTGQVEELDAPEHAAGARSLPPDAETGRPSPAPPAPPRRRPVFWAVVAAVLVAAVALAVWLESRDRSISTFRPPRSVAVLPFVPVGAASSDEHLEVGLADVLIARLSELGELEVRPLGAVLRYAGSTLDPLEAGRALGVEAVLEGTLRRQDERLRVTARLITVPDGHALWVGSFDHADRDLLGVEQAIGREAALALRPALRAATPDAASLATPPIDAEAHDLYLRGRFFWSKRNVAALRRSVELFDAALARAPDYAAAEAGLASAYALLGGIAEPPEVYEQARGHAARALALDPGSADARAVLGLVASNYDGDWALAESEYRRALAVQPNHPTAHHWLGEMLALLGRFDEGIALLERAQQLDPLSLPIATDLAKANYFARRYERAIALGEEVLAMDSQHAWAWAWVGGAELARGNAERAVDSLRRFRDLDGSAFSRALLVAGLEAAGRGEEARAEHEALEEEARRGYVMPVARMMARAARGDRSGALDAYEELLATKQNRLGTSTAPLFDPLREEPRWADLLRRAGLPPPP